MNTYYTEYVNHMFRYYFSLSEPQDTVNYRCVSLALASLSPEERDIIRAVYAVRTRRMSDAVATVAADKGVPAYSVYSVLRSAARMVASERGLIDG